MSYIVRIDENHGADVVVWEIRQKGQEVAFAVNHPQVDDSFCFVYDPEESLNTTLPLSAAVLQEIWNIPGVISVEPYVDEGRRIC